MLIKPVKYKGKNLNCLKFKRIIGKDKKLKLDDIHVVMTNVELMRMYEMLHKKFGNAEQFLAVPVKKIAPKPEPPKPETIALFGMVGEEVEV